MINVRVSNWATRGVGPGNNWNGRKHGSKRERELLGVRAVLVGQERAADERC